MAWQLGNWVIYRTHPVHIQRPRQAVFHTKARSEIPAKTLSKDLMMWFSGPKPAFEGPDSKKFLLCCFLVTMSFASRFDSLCFGSRRVYGLATKTWHGEVELFVLLRLKSDCATDESVSRIMMPWCDMMSCAFAWLHLATIVCCKISMDLWIWDPEKWAKKGCKPRIAITVKGRKLF